MPKDEIKDVDLFFAKHFREDLMGLMTSLMQRSRSGHICIHLEQPLKEKIDSPLVHEEEGRVYLKRNWVAEEKFVKALKKILLRKKEETDPSLEFPLDFKGLNEEQRNAVSKAFKSSIFLLVGGPGRGKTYTASAIVRNFLKVFPEKKIQLAAPTGKAASCLESAVNRHGLSLTAQTLHSLLKIKSFEDYVKHTPYIEADLLIVDESSMIDAPLFGKLLEAIGPETKLILMGDSDQLPPVESGSFFGDMVDFMEQNKKEALCRLSVSMRTERIGLVSFADSIAREDLPSLELFDGIYLKNDDFSDKKKLYEEIYKIVKEHVADQKGKNLEDLFSLFQSFRLLSSLRQGPFGSDALNAFIFSSMKEEFNSFAYPILITKNNQELLNGQSGIVIDAFAYFEGKEKIPLNSLPSFEYGYCLSVHKSQGSEYENVLLLLPPGSENFGREILYTAVTRAKKSCSIFGSLETMNALCKMDSRKESGVKAKMQSNFNS